MDSNGARSDQATGGPPDAVLARRVQEGDREAFEILARRYLRPIHAVAASFLRERADVEDASQETFLKALRAIRSFDSKRPFAPWLYQIARNVARNRLAERKRHATDPVTDLAGSLPDPAASPADGAESAELGRRVSEAIEALPERRRTAFRLADVEGYSAVEVARIMGLTAGAVRAHIHHARKDLRIRLAHLVEDENEHVDE